MEKIPMYINLSVYGKVLSSAYGNTFWAPVLCGVVENEEVDVYQIGLPDATGAEFLYYFKNWQSPSTEQQTYLSLPLSATNGWGHANCSCFKPKS